MATTVCGRRRSFAERETPRAALARTRWLATTRSGACLDESDCTSKFEFEGKIDPGDVRTNNVRDEEAAAPQSTRLSRRRRRPRRILAHQLARRPWAIHLSKVPLAMVLTHVSVARRRVL